MTAYVVTAKVIVEADSHVQAAQQVIDVAKAQFDDWDVQETVKIKTGVDPFTA